MHRRVVCILFTRVSGVANVLLQVLAKLKSDDHAAALLKLSIGEVGLGRLVGPLKVEEVDMAEGSIASRFSVVQGVLPDGEPKVRAVDNMTESKVNQSTAAQEKLKYSTLDWLFVSMQRMMRDLACPLSMWKADIDCAYRRLPLLPEHRRHARVAFRSDGGVKIFQHCALPFGAISSVHHWERIGALLCAISRRILHLPVYRFVDDFFAACRATVADHSMQMFARHPSFSFVWVHMSCLCVLQAGAVPVRCHINFGQKAGHRQSLDGSGN